MSRRSPTGVVALLALALASPSMTARAEGAIALGLPNDVASDGAAVGWAVNQVVGRAADLAVQQCRKRTDVPPATRDLCRVVQVFSDACISVALDPAEGTPGFGWAVAATKEQADAAAMRGCQQTAGADRQQYCKIAAGACDRRS